jgi:hypothetical protein
MLSNVYLKDVSYADNFRKLVFDIYNTYDNINIYIERSHEYQEYGRYQNEDEANTKADEIIDILTGYRIPFHRFKSNDPELIQKIIKLL